MSTSRSPWHRKSARALLAAGGLIALAGCSVSADVVAYDLPTQAAKYSFQADTNGTKTVWEYTSAQPETSDATKVEPCVGDIIQKKKQPCRPEPLIFLRYDLGLDLDNTAKSGGVHHITVTGYYQERLSTPPTVTDLRAETTVDGGKTWQLAMAKGAGGNSFGVDVQHPMGDQAASEVGLRVSAKDSAGNTVVQTIPTAYQLR